MTTLPAPPPAPRRGRPLAARLPDPDHLWIRHAPRTWELAPGPWLDLGAGGLRGLELSSRAPDEARAVSLDALGKLVASPVDDVVWAPPGGSAAIAEVLAPAVERGVPVLLQRTLGDFGEDDPWPGARPEPVHEVFDPTAALLAAPDDPLAAFDSLPAGAVVVWPLIPGFSDDPTLWEAACTRLAGRGARTVQAVVPEISSGERRQLADQTDGRAFEALFHGPPPDPRRFARVARRHGLGIFFDRPPPGPPLGDGGVTGNRHLAGLLALAGELSVRLDLAPGKAQGYLRAARFADRTRYDLLALAREGNLPVLPWLDPASRELVEEWAETGRSGAVDGLLDDYAGPEDPDAPKTSQGD
jgi:hypothetical protein